MRLNQHELCTRESNKHSCIRIGKYRDLTRYASQIVLLCIGAAVCYRMYVNLFAFSLYHIDCLLRAYNRGWSRVPQGDFGSEEIFHGYS